MTPTTFQWYRKHSQSIRRDISCLYYSPLTLSSNNTRWYADITKLAQAMGSVLCSSVAALHVFTGCDFTSSSQRQTSSSDINSERWDMEDSICNVRWINWYIVQIDYRLGKFCRLYIYSKPKVTSVNTARHMFFQQQYARRCHSQPQEKKLKGTDSSNLPPCQCS